MPTNFANASYTGGATGMFTRTLGNRATDVFCVRDFFQSGDTNWLPAINRAMTASGTANGGIIYFPPGSYTINGPIIPPDDQACRKLVGCGGQSQGKGTTITGNFADYLIAVPQNTAGNEPIVSIEGIWFTQQFVKAKGAMTQIDSPSGLVSAGNGYGCLALGLSFSSITDCTVQLAGGGVGIYYQGIENYIRNIQVIGQTSGVSTAPECIGIWLENGKIEVGKIMTCRMGIVAVTNSGISVEQLNIERNQHGIWLAPNPLAYFDRNASVPPPIKVNAIGSVTPARASVRDCHFDSHGSLTEGGSFIQISSSGNIIENLQAESHGQSGFIPDHGYYINGSNTIRNANATGTFNIAAIEVTSGGGNSTLTGVSGSTSDPLPSVNWKLPTASNSMNATFTDCNVDASVPLSVIVSIGGSRDVLISDSVDPAWILPSGPSNIGKPIVGGGTYKVVGHWNGSNWAIAGGQPGVLSGDPVAMFLARTTGLDTPHTTAYTNLINSLISAGLINASNGTSDYFDTLFITAAKAPQANGLLSLLNGPPNATVVGTVTFTADRGFSVAASSNGNGIFTNVSLVGGHYTENNAHMSVWIADNPSTTNAACGYMNTSSPTDWQISQIYPRSSADGKAYYRINDKNGLPSAGITTATAQGHYIANRTTIDTQQGIKNGVDQGVVSIVNSGAGNRFAPPLGPTGLAFCATSNVTSLPGTLATGFPGQIAMFSSGGSLNSTQATNFYNALRTYMTAVGVP
jgi:Pectate lyase superfamily protein